MEKKTEKVKPGSEVIKLFMLNSVEHDLLNAHKYKDIKKFGYFRMLFFPLILTFMSRKIFMLS